MSLYYKIKAGISSQLLLKQNNIAEIFNSPLHV